MKPFLKWAGNKYRILEQLRPLLPEGKRLVEPFAGSGALFLNSHYPRYLLAEHNEDLVNLYQTLQNEGQDFIEYCREFFTSDFNAKHNYYELRDTFNRSQKRRLKSALFLYLNRHGYNGLCRYNQQGQFNVPFGQYLKPYFPEKEMRHFHHKSQSCDFIHADFLDTMQTLVTSGDIVYCDPPYAPIDGVGFTAYTQTPFGENQQLALAEAAETLAKRGIPVIISNHDTAFTRNCYERAKIISFEVQRSVSCKGQQRRKVRELIALYL